MSPIQVTIVPVTPFQQNCSLVWCTKTMRGAFVDAGGDIDQLLAACKRYFQKTGRRISFEYALIAGVNDSPAQAVQLAQRLKGFGCHVNLIPVNEVPERAYRRSPADLVSRFKAALEAQGINATVRRSLGGDISAACGQLRREQSAKGGDEG